MAERTRVSFNDSRRDFTESFPRLDQGIQLSYHTRLANSPCRHSPNEQIQIKRHAILVNILRTLTPSHYRTCHSCWTFALRTFALSLMACHDFRCSLSRLSFLSATHSNIRLQILNKNPLLNKNSYNLINR